MSTEYKLSYTASQIDEKLGKIDGLAAKTDLTTHTSNKSNPHGVTAAQTGALPASGGNVTGHIYLTGAKENSSTSSTSQIVFGSESNNHVVISSNNNAIVINPTTAATTNQIVLYLDKASQFPSGIKTNVTGNLSGTATKAAQDASGNVITSTYAKKSEIPTDDYINSLIDAKLGVIENASY